MIQKCFALQVKQNISHFFLLELQENNFVLIWKTQTRLLIYYLIVAQKAPNKNKKRTAIKNEINAQRIMSKAF